MGIGHPRAYLQLSPEVNSANIYGGPDAGSLLEAAQTWERVATEMSAGVVEPFMRVLDVLLEQWSGASAMQMHQATGPFFGWLVELQQRLDMTHKVTRLIRKSYSIARAKMVSPWEIDQNLTQRRQLAWQNPLGRNAEAIAALEAQYRQYWEQDIKVMADYHKAIFSAMRHLTSWRRPPPLTTGTGLAKPATTV